MIRAIVLGLVIFSLTACGGTGFKIGKEEYRQRVRTLGVVPLLVDGSSQLDHPRASEVVALLRRRSSGQHLQLVELLKEQKGYFDVRPVAGNPVALFDRLVRGRAWQEGGDGPYHHYRFDPRTVAELNRQQSTDALLVIVLNGAVRTEKRWDRTRLSYLEAPFNSILAAAAVVLPSGEIVWEHPGGKAFLDMQYPAFDEAYYNMTEEVPIRFITLGGLERHLNEPGRKLLQGAVLPLPYQELFDLLASDLKPGLLNPFKSTDSAQ